ncbi:Nucleosomal histone H3-Lys79 methylase [Coemansia asiatica]|uniref:Histone-lysine N-methyltransferase, H3 lysine-79 specific n=1 Tax=Coemansia asiatica TaxID=1052880 RepID=A0A9W7XLC4_9FUNG|nr:Nucleosomal histone H3-Lys79 methylase [Coemansia asiatica]
MDLFFGSAKAKAKATGHQPQTVSIRVEERVVSRKHRRAAAVDNAEAQQPAKRPVSGKRFRTEDKEDKEDDRIARLAARRLAKSSAMSTKDTRIVNSNRERVGSLPGTPRPRREQTAKRRSPQTQQPKKQPTSPRVAEEPVEIGRSSSVPAHSSAADAGSDNDGDAASIVSSAEAVRLSETSYEAYFQWAQDQREPPTEVELHLPAGGIDGRETYSLMVPRGFDRESEQRDEYLPIDDLLATVRAIGTYLVGSEQFRRKVVDDQETGIVRRLERARNRRGGAGFVAAVRDFNALLDSERVDAGTRRAANEVAVFVVEQVYSRVVAPTVGLLRQYKAFSNNVYGEILPTLVSEFIARTGIEEASTFVDLGCGIGNVVLQVAAQTGCRAAGIEIMKVPARFAQRQAREFAHRMRLYGLRHGPVSIWRGDFCESPDVQRILPTVDVLLVNNYAFDSALNQNLLQMFLDLKDGARVISLRPFVTPDHKISARNVYAPESILAVRRFPYWSNCVSWTDSGGEYFVQTVDRSRVKQFLAQRSGIV